LLFKYLPPERVDVLSSLRLRFTPLISMNDPFEHTLRIGTKEYAIDSDPTMLRVEPTAFVSLSRNNSNILMWSHYAESHKGFCIGFKRNNTYFSKAESVRYRRYRSHLNGMSIDLFPKDPNLKGISLEKAIDWAYEEEERLFLCDVEKDLLNVGVDEWGQPITLNTYPHSSIAAIYLGMRASDDLKIQVKEALKRNSLDIPIYKAKKCIDQFALEFELCT